MCVYIIYTHIYVCVCVYIISILLQNCYNKNFVTKLILQYIQ